MGNRLERRARGSQPVIALAIWVRFNILLVCQGAWIPDQVEGGPEVGMNEV